MFAECLYIALCVIVLPSATGQGFMDKKTALTHCRSINPPSSEECIHKCTLVSMGRIDGNGFVLPTPYNTEAAGYWNNIKILNQGPCAQAIIRLFKMTRRQITTSVQYCGTKEDKFDNKCYRSCVFKRQGFLNKNETINVESFKRYTTQKNVESFLKVCSSIVKPSGKKCYAADLVNCMVTSISDQLLANQIHHKNIVIKVQDEIRYATHQKFDFN